MTDRPIIFSAPMVRALLDGRKTQTRRVLKPPYGTLEYLRDGTWRPICIKFFPGDRLYVREQCATWGRGPERATVEFPVAYAADDTEWDAINHDARNSKTGDGWKIRPSIHMPRWASRLTLTVTDVRVQRLQDISEADAVAEGIDPLFSPAEVAQRPELGEKPMPWLNYLWHGHHDLKRDQIDAWPHQYSSYSEPASAFSSLWEKLHGPGAWAANPWVVALTFTVQHGNIDQLAVRP